MNPNPPPRLSQLSVAVVTFNEADNLPRCLASVSAWAGEIVVIDSGSTDATVDIAKGFGARVHQQQWLGFRDQKNVALSHCKLPWVLALDADEAVSEEMTRSIFEFFSNGGPHEQHVGASFNRRTWFIDRWILHGDWYPDRKLRLFKLQHARWGGSPEHDRIEIDAGNTQLHMKGDILHYSFPDMNRFVQKINVFSDVYLQRMIEGQRRWSLAANVFRPLWRFFRGYVLRRGFLDGFPGFWIATAVGFQTFVRHSRLYEHQHRPAQGPPQPGDTSAEHEAES